jgi:hypothetical protein
MLPILNEFYEKINNRASFDIIFFILVIWSKLIILCISAYFEGSRDSLSLLPADKIVIKLVGENNSWYVSGQGGSTESLQWQHKTSSESLVNISTPQLQSNV